MKVGFVGSRGMVGSVLMQRMQEEGDFDYLPDRVFFSTSQVGQEGPPISGGQPLEDANSIEALRRCDIIVTCQGGNWTSKIYPQLVVSGWKGIWIDTASALRMRDDSIIVLDPLNRKIIERGLKNGVKAFIGGNCTVSLMLMACQGLFKKNLVEWVFSATYQAASGAGAAYMQELVRQMQFISKETDPAQAALELDRVVAERLQAADFPAENFGVPLVANLIPWIDKAIEIDQVSGQTREEWKGFVEANKILGTEARPIPIDGICVRVGAMRSHSQALFIKLKRDVPLTELNTIIANANKWVTVVPNLEYMTKEQLTPMAVSGKLDIAIGRLHKTRMGPKYLEAFTVGDQLLWGAAEPIRRTLRIILGTM